MQISYPSFDQFVTEHFSDVYRLCFLLTRDPSGAWQTAFQTFLYIGTQPGLSADSSPDSADTSADSSADREAEQDVLFSWCIRTCTDYYYRKIRRRLKRELFEKKVPFPVTDNLWNLLGMPFQKRISIFFTCFLGFTPERTAHILEGNAGRHAATVRTAPEGAADLWREAISSITPAGDGAVQMLGEVYLRFEERNVPLENKLRDIRHWWDHAVIWIAAAIVVLFAAAAWYTAQIVV